MKKNNYLYDYLIVGSGLFGATFNYLIQKKFNGKVKCLVIDRRSQVGGNLFCKSIANINVHAYGPHVFHTDNKNIWDLVNEISPCNRFTVGTVAKYKGKIYNLPFNMNTFYQLWGVQTPKEAIEKIESQKLILKSGKEPTNLEEQALSLVGTDIYEKLIKGYTEKQWGCSAKDLPAFIIKRLPLRFIFDNNYFNNLYQGVPIGGYNVLINGLLKGSEVRLNCDFIKEKKELIKLAKNIIYTGPLDEFFNYKLGRLDYRSLRFETEVLDLNNFQGNAVINFTDRNVPYTRIVEHKHFEFGNQPQTVITKEFPENFVIGKEPYYPINNKKNNDLAEEYKKMTYKFLRTENKQKIFFGGRLAEYQYYDMDKVIESAIKMVEKISNEK